MTKRALFVVPGEGLWSLALPSGSPSAKLFVDQFSIKLVVMLVYSIYH